MIRETYRRKYSKTLPSFFIGCISFFLIISMYLSIQRIQSCTDFDEGKTKLKMASVIFPSFFFLFLIPPIFISWCNLSSKTSFYIDIWSFVGTFISIIAIIICSYCIATIPNGIMNIDEEKRLQMETEGECCYTTSYLKEVHVKNYTFNQGYVFCDCQYVRNITTINKIEETNQCEVYMKHENFCCEGNIVNDIRFGVFLLISCLACFTSFVTGCVGIHDLQKNVHFFSKLNAKRKGIVFRDYSNLPDNTLETVEV